MPANRDTQKGNTGIGQLLSPILVGLWQPSINSAPKQSTVSLASCISYADIFPVQLSKVQGTIIGNVHCDMLLNLALLDALHH